MVIEPIKLLVENSKDIEILLRSIIEQDLEKLRTWKNRNRKFFFYQNIISVNKQANWFKTYKLNDNNFLFIVECNKRPIGCMGIRALKNQWDIFNVILGEKSFSKKGIMSKAFKKMLVFAQQNKNLNISLKVLKDNPAIQWYEKIGFSFLREEKNYLELIYKA